MVNVLYIGSFPTTELIRNSLGKIDSLYRDSQAVISGLRSCPQVNINILTSPDIRSYPNNNVYYHSYFDKTDNALMVSSLNLKGIKQIWTVLSMSRAARLIIEKNQGVTNVVIPYMVFRHVMAARLIKFLFRKKVKICIIIPDIFFPKKCFSKFINNWTEGMTKRFDSFVLYTDAMADYLAIRDRRHIVIEGFHKVEKRSITPPIGRFVITYAGSLNLCYGIGRLLDAFKKIIYQDIELHLYGRGDAEELIMECAKSDTRIKYFGLVPKEQATAALYRSSLLINPRNATDGEYVQYSFPSKDIDYLASGVPCVLCKLPGMPKEYYGHFIDAGDGSAESLAAAINEAYSMVPDQRESLAIKAQQFISERMDTKKQAEQIIQLINS